MDITAMLKQQIMNILQSQIAIGQVCKVERRVLNSVIEIWKSTELLAVVKHGSINMQLMLPKLTVPFIFPPDSD